MFWSMLEPLGSINNTLFSSLPKNGPNKLEQSVIFHFSGKVFRDKHSSLLGSLESYEENEVL